MRLFCEFNMGIPAAVCEKKLAAHSATRGHQPSQGREHLSHARRLWPRWMIQEFPPPLTVRVITRMNVRGFISAYPLFLGFAKQWALTLL